MKTAKPAVTSRGLLFKTPMIRSFLRPVNPKRQTRRTFRVQPPPDIPAGYYLDAYNGGPEWCWWTPDGRVANSLPTIKCPFGVVGDSIYAKETWARVRRYGEDTVLYRADGETRFCVELRNCLSDREPRMGDVQEAESTIRTYREKWRSSMMMPRWAARIHRTLTAIRAEPVNRISEADAMAEGLSYCRYDEPTWKWGIPGRNGLPNAYDDGWEWKDWETDPRRAYRRLWDSISGSGSFDSGVWCWVLEFGSIDNGGES